MQSPNESTLSLLQPGLLTDERRLSVIIQSLFSAWMLAFLFQGQIFISLAAAHNFDPSALITYATLAMLAGHLLSGVFIQSKASARRLWLYAYPFFALLTLIFFFPPNLLWSIAIVSGSFLAGISISAWAFYLRSSSPKGQRFRTVADLLILSNLFMIFLNLVGSYISPSAGLALSILLLAGAYFLTQKLPDEAIKAAAPAPSLRKGAVQLKKSLAFLSLFIVIITINAGLMYRLVNPAFAHLEGLVSWYWAVPYIAAILIIKNLPDSINKTYLLYIALGMIGLSFIAFTALNRTVLSYLLVDTLMLGAFGVYDLFWWTILGEMLEYHKNPALVLGIGLGANLLGVLIGAQIVIPIVSADGGGHNPAFLALFVVCVTLMLLPLLHKQLTLLLREHASFLLAPDAYDKALNARAQRIADYGLLSEREAEIAARLLQGKTYKTIASELFLSENTIKFHVKNIYGKFHISSRTELIQLLTDADSQS